MERRHVCGRCAAVWLAATGVAAIAAARSAGTVAVAGVLVVAAVVVWRRSTPFGGERPGAWWRALAAGAALLAVAQLAGLLVRGDGDAVGLDPVSRSYGRLGLPPVPFPRRAAYAATLADGTVVRAWRTGAATLHLRVDTAAARCRTWKEWWHTADIPDVRVGAHGTFRATGGRVERAPAAVHTSAFVIRGVRARGALRGTFVRTDRYRGHVDGVCRRTVRFTAAASR